jgi:hypothetical protein
VIIVIIATRSLAHPTSSYPVGIALYYFYKSEEARMRWRDKLGLTVHATTADMPIDQDRFSLVVQENSTFNPTNRSMRSAEVEVV